MPIGESIYLDLLLDKLFEYKISQIYMSLYYKSDLFQYYVDQSIYRNKIKTIIEPEPLGTGGAINYVINNSSISSPFFVINGDSFSDIKLDQMFNEFNNKNYIAMIGISKIKNAERYGKVILENTKIISFEEKGITDSGWINNGHYIFNKEIFNNYGYIFSLEKDLFPKLIDNNELGVFKVIDDNFIDIGIPIDYKKLNQSFKEKK